MKKDKPVPPGSLGVEVKDLLEWLRVLLKHAYVRFGRWLRRQIAGIPMGTQCGPDLANLFGLHFELKLLQTLVKKVLDKEQPEAVRKEALEACSALRFYVRFIDDMLNFNNVHFQMIMNAYPDGIKFEAATEIGVGINGIAFTDAYIYQSPVWPYPLQISLFDKRRGRGFKKLTVLQYTHWESFLPAKIKLNILTSQREQREAVGRSLHEHLH